MKFILTVIISIVATFTYAAVLAGMIALLFGVGFTSVTTFPGFIALMVILGIPAAVCTADAINEQLAKEGV
jgi:hypothetical protein